MILVTRHGQTNWNLQQRVMGNVDISLNEKGINQAYITKEIVNNYNIDLIICSPLERAKQTAKIINEDKMVDIIYDDRIIERDFGEFEGLKYDEFDNETLWDYYKNKQYKQAECMKNFFDRVYSFCQDIEKYYSGLNILLVTHGGVSVALNCYFNNNIPEGSLSNRGLFLKNCEVAIYNKEKAKEKRIYGKKNE